ncbi:Alpha/Beta hydrolase protein [Mycena vitilis]|nr:Alpha/Beta hydrolase protein [Mycena vitilis]
MTTATPTPSGLDADPSAYLALPRFNYSLDFEFSLPGASNTTPATVTYALTAAPPDAACQWPLIVFFNGLGGHRLIAALLEGIAVAHQVRILTLDRPGCGGSTSVPLALRTRWTHAAHLAVFAHLHTTRFALISHSAGLFYALHFLLHLPATLSVSSWTLSGPFIPPQISGSPLLRLAALLPNALPGALGGLVQLAPAIARAVSWSGGLSAGLLGKTATHDDEEQRELRKPPHRRGYLHRSVNEAVREAMMARGIREARGAMGQEALVCLHGGDSVSVPRSSCSSGSASSASCNSGSSTPSPSAPAPALVTPDDSEAIDTIWALGPGPTPAAVLQGAFTRIAERYPGNALDVHVVYGADDILVPVKGRVWLRGVLEETGLLPGEDADRWREVPDAGHDEILFLEEGMSGMLGRAGRGSERRGPT